MTLIGITHLTGSKNGKDYDFHVLNFVDDSPSRNTVGSRSLAMTAGERVNVSSLTIGAEYDVFSAPTSNGRLIAVAVLPL